jgi:hypothetical protein
MVNKRYAESGLKYERHADMDQPPETEELVTVLKHVGMDDFILESLFPGASLFPHILDALRSSPHTLTVDHGAEHRPRALRLSFALRTL